MTKIYVVKGYYLRDKWSQTINLAVFTNRKLAKTYLNYKKLSRKQKPMNDVDIVSYELEEFSICKIDWSEELLKLQMEELPY